jgi:hypothetical protein
LTSRLTSDKWREKKNFDYLISWRSGQMAENKDKFSLDDILNEYTHKSSGGGMDVEDIINETMHSAKIVGAEYNDDKKEEKEPETKTEPKIEANSAEISFKDFDDLDNREEEPEKPYEAEEFEKAK